METLLLVIAVNFLIVPFLQEAEAQGRQLLRFPGLLRILRLAHVRRSHWFRPFCLFALLFLSLAVARAQEGRASALVLAVHFAIMQAVLWAVVALSVRKHAHRPSAAVTVVGAETDLPPIAPLLRRL